MQVILKHLIDAVDLAPLDLEPYPHIYMEQVLPADTYADLLATLPAPERYRRMSLQVESRDEIDLIETNLGGAWTGIVKAFTSPEFKLCMFTKMAIGLCERFKVDEQAAINLPTEVSVRLFRDTKNYYIWPHTDTLKKMVMMQFYLPPDDSMIDLGTSLLRVTGVNQYAEVKRFPFRVNSAYGFVVSNGAKWPSWHCREKLANFTGVRNSIAVVFRQPIKR